MQAEHCPWNPAWRARFLQGLGEDSKASEWDVIVIGGGITGAGIFRELARQGLRVLLLEQRDFAWGTSSRSSKMVHGGLRYLAAGAFGLTRESVRERQRLLDEAPGLVEPLPFLYPHYRGAFPPPWLFGIVLALYDLMAGIWNHRFLRHAELQPYAPGLREDGLLGAMQFADAVTDDARLTLRVIREGMLDGGSAVNYMRVSSCHPEGDGLHAVAVEEVEGGVTHYLRSRMVVNATGAWADILRDSTTASIRPLRGSHLVFPAGKLPVGQTISFRHPDDKRPVFVFPWEGVTVVGTTDLDHATDLDAEAAISESEVDYLLSAARYQLPGYPVTRADVLSTWSGVRPVISSGAGLDPSQEKREHSIWEESGLLTVSGGKLTTFRVIAEDVLGRAHKYLPAMQELSKGPVFSAGPAEALQGFRLSPDVRRRLHGRLGREVAEFATLATDAELQAIAGSTFCRAELRWSLRNECVMHLDDLMLRRTRLGNVLPHGGADILDDVLQLCREELEWDAARCTSERELYLQTWQRHYALPPATGHKPS